MNKNRKYPAILEIHGGPRTQYGFTFFHEMQYLAAGVMWYCTLTSGAAPAEEKPGPRLLKGVGATWTTRLPGGSRLPGEATICGP